MVTKPRPDPRVATLERTVAQLRAEIARLDAELVKANVDQQDLHRRLDGLPRASRGAPRSTVHRSSTRPSLAVEACIVARENGGSYGRSSNPSHFGRYQFDRRTWAANGGDPATWGSASPAEQDAVFRTTVARRGYTPWTPYDGC